MSETLLVREEATQNYLLVEGNDDVNILYHLPMHIFIRGLPGRKNPENQWGKPLPNIISKLKLHMPSIW